MFTHIGMLTLTPGAGPEAVATITGRLEALVGLVPGLVAVSVHPDLGLNEGNASLVFLADFDDEAAWQGYRTHPAHVAVIQEAVGPVLAGKTFVQVARA
jgi:quinol monooxygenase YgiN